MLAAKPAVAVHPNRKPTDVAVTVMPSASGSVMRGGLTPRSRAESTPCTPGNSDAERAARSISASVAVSRVSITVQRWPSV